MIPSYVTFQGPVAIKVAKKAIDNGMQVYIQAACDLRTRLMNPK